MSRQVAHWYVDYTDGQVEAFERGGHWYLRMPESWEMTTQQGQTAVDAAGRGGGDG
jgi:hypothetical protein